MKLISDIKTYQQNINELRNDFTHNELKTLNALTGIVAVMGLGIIATLGINFIRQYMFVLKAMFIIIGIILISLNALFTLTMTITNKVLINVHYDLFKKRSNIKNIALYEFIKSSIISILGIILIIVSFFLRG